MLAINMLSVSDHAAKRMSKRGLFPWQIDLVIKYGRRVHSRRAVYYALGRREVSRYQEKMPELVGLESIQVVVNSEQEVILTVYRNHDFRKIRPCKRRHRKLA